MCVTRRTGHGSEFLTPSSSFALISVQGQNPTLVAFQQHLLSCGVGVAETKTGIAVFVLVLMSGP